jgi:hypothetical protein
VTFVGLTDKERELLDALLVMHFEAMDADAPEGPLTVDEVVALRRRIADPGSGGPQDEGVLL